MAPKRKPFLFLLSSNETTSVDTFPLSPLAFVFVFFELVDFSALPICGVSLTGVATDT